MMQLVLLALSGFLLTSGALPSGESREADLHSSIVFNQLALAQVFETLKNISQDDAATVSHLEQLSQKQDRHLQDLATGLSRVTASVESLSQTMTSHLRTDEVLQRDVRSCSSVTDVLEQRVVLQRAELSERREAQARRKALEAELEEELLRSRTRTLEAEEERVSLQAQDAQLRYEEAEARIQLLQASDALQRLRGEEKRLEADLLLLEGESDASSEEMEALDADLEALRRRLADAEEAEASLEQTKATEAQQRAEVSRRLSQVVASKEQLEAAKSHLEEDVERIQSEGRRAHDQQTSLEAKASELSSHKVDLEGRVQSAINRKNQVIQKIKTLNADIEYLENEVFLSDCA